jgi:hypothetical protein
MTAFCQDIALLIISIHPQHMRHTSPWRQFLRRHLIQHNQDFLISRSSLKDYVRIPKITPKDQKLKDKIVALTESMLALETVTLRDIVDFTKLNVQKFDSMPELKSLPAVDFDKQNAIKKEIDDLVFALYFDVPVKDVAKHEFYGYVN